MTTAPSGLTGPVTAAAQQSDAARTPRKPRGGAGRGTAWYRRLTPYYFLLVPVGLLLLLTSVPVLNMFWYSVTDWDGLDKTKNFVGLENFVDVFTDCRKTQTKSFPPHGLKASRWRFDGSGERIG